MLAGLAGALSAVSLLRRADAAGTGPTQDPVPSPGVGPRLPDASPRAADDSERHAGPPPHGLRDFMRMFSGLSGEVCLTNEGTIYGRPAGELPRPLFGYRSAVIIRTREIDAGVFRTEQREAMHYVDLASGDPLQSFANPYNGEVQIPVGYVSPLNVYFFDRTGSYSRQLPEQRAGQLHLDWRADNDTVWVSESRYNVFPSGVTEAEFPRAYSGPERRSVDILTYRAAARDLANRRLESILAEVSMLSDTPWPLWMMMGRQPGSVLWQGFGRKYRSFAALPRRFAAATEQVYPRFLADPWAFPEREFSTAAQLRRLRAQGKIQ
jgi:hypothetical protein